MKLLSLLRTIKKSLSRYEPLVEVLIHKEHIIHNIETYKTHAKNLQIAPVLKSNAYGHGLLNIAKILDTHPIPFFVVDSLFEAIILRNEKIHSPILVIGHTTTNNIIHNTLKHVAFTIATIEQLKELSHALTHPQSIHLKIDTGMHRQGIALNELEYSIELIQNNNYIHCDGICSHLADADNSDEHFTLLQIERWNSIVKLYKHHFPHLKYTHLSASAGISYREKINANVFRLGLGLYGINPSPLIALDLKPTLEMKTIITALRTIAEGECVGYGLTFRAHKEMKIATIPVGYFEGIDRRLSNKGCVKIKNQFCPIIGRVSMNMSSIDISAIPDIKIGESVTVISAHKEDLDSIEHIARLCNTIPYEILVHIPPHLRRRVI